MDGETSRTSTSSPPHTCMASLLAPAGWRTRWSHQATGMATRGDLDGDRCSRARPLTTTVDVAAQTATWVDSQPRPVGNRAGWRVSCVLVAVSAAAVPASHVAYATAPGAVAQRESVGELTIVEYNILGAYHKRGERIGGRLPGRTAGAARAARFLSLGDLVSTHENMLQQRL